MKVPKEEEEEEGRGRTIVVGVRKDQQSKELLTWALVKIAAPGDQVLALHILPSSSSSGPMDTELESMLAVYEGFCNLKQVDLKLKVCKGSSLRRILVREAAAFAAAYLILGVAKNAHVIGPSPVSVAKYCAKKLSKSCSVLAVNNGKPVFQTEAKENKGCDATGSKPSLQRVASKCRIDDNPALVEAPSEQNCSICDSKRADEKLEKPSSSSNSMDDNSLSEVKTGWPVVRKSVLTREKPKASVIQWAMRLPARYSTSSVASPERKPKKTKPLNRCDLNVENNEERKLPKELESLHEKYSSVCRLFSFKELVDATSNFSTEKLTGKGGSSRVYKGSFPNDKDLAVKILKPSDDAMKEFISEIEIITTLSHTNIISLIGFCVDKDHQILVYEFLSRGSLEENLHGDKQNKRVVSWAERYKVAVGVAEALDYLHGGNGSQPVIHKDVKSSNILLSDDFEPQLSDFGLATWASASQSPITCSDVAGTFGYLAPEYFMYGKVNEKIDVYAFGVVLLELVSGRKPISAEGPQGQKSLVMWANSILHGGKTKELVDPCLTNEHDSDQLERMILVASLCIRRTARSRPKMSQVLKILQGDEETLKWAESNVSISEESDALGDEDEVLQPNANIRSHLNLALLDIEDDSTSISSTEQTLDFVSSNTSLDDHLQGKWSRSSSFD